MKITYLLKKFINSEKIGGLLLICCAIISLMLANSDSGEEYLAFWHTSIGGQSLEYWINDGLMTVFFLLIGLELEREVYKGELSTLKNALFPTIAAVGGMLVPASIYLLFNYGTPAHSGAGIPMATDIAFALGILSLLGNSVPVSLKVFLAALAIIDDLGAVLVIAVFYTTTIFWTNLLIALALFIFMLILNRLRVRNLIPYLIAGFFMWYFMLNSGVHATITGVLLAFAIPFGNGDPTSTSSILQGFLHKPVAFIILPIFALANTAIFLDADIADIISQNYSLGIALGLIVGKPLGIFMFSFLAVQLGICRLPSELTWKNILGVGLLAGIGFTMSIFITLLAFDDQTIINHSKIAILLSSLTAGIIGFTFLKINLKHKKFIK